MSSTTFWQVRPADVNLPMIIEHRQEKNASLDIYDLLQQGYYLSGEDAESTNYSILVNANPAILLRSHSEWKLPTRQTETEPSHDYHVTECLSSKENDK